MKDQSEWKRAELSENIIDKDLHKFFKAVLNEINITFSTLGETVSEVPHFIPEPSNFSEVTILPADVKNV